MAVIKCSNCENEILDNEIVCPYCDCPLSETLKKMKKDDLADFSEKSIDGITGRIPVIKDAEEPKIATSSDFEKEKAAILKDINLNVVESEKTAESADEAEDANIEKTLKISLDDILNGKVKADNVSGTALKEKANAQPTQKKANPKPRKTRAKNEKTKYIILAVTVIGIILIGFLIKEITGTISDGISRQKKTNKTVSVTSSAEEISKEQGFTFSSSTLTIIDEKVMVDYESAKDAPWYQYKDSVKHITIGDDVTKIGAHAFDGYKNVTDITFSKDVSVIGDYAFYNCASLKKLRLPDNNDLMEIGESSFEKCSKLEFISGYTKEAKFEPSLLVIGDKAFAGCSAIMEFKLPDDIKLGEDVFKSHNKDFAIICSELGNAFDYAKENEISVKKDFNEGIIENVAKEEEEEKEKEKEKEKEEEKKETETTKEPSEESATTKPAGTQTGSNTNQGTTQAPETQAPAKSSEDMLKELTGKLNQATTDQEREAILKEMDKHMSN